MSIVDTTWLELHGQHHPSNVTTLCFVTKCTALCLWKPYTVVRKWTRRWETQVTKNSSNVKDKLTALGDGPSLASLRGSGMCCMLGWLWGMIVSDARNEAGVLEFIKHLNNLLCTVTSRLLHIHTHTHNVLDAESFLNWQSNLNSKWQPDLMVGI